MCACQYQKANDGKLKKNQMRRKTILEKGRMNLVLVMLKMKVQRHQRPLGAVTVQVKTKRKTVVVVVKSKSKGYTTTTTIIFMPGTSDEQGTGADPTTDDVREEVQQKISKFGLTVDSVQKVDLRTNPIIQKMFKDID